jgi:FkbM family methyltransferase
MASCGAHPALAWAARGLNQLLRQAGCELVRHPRLAPELQRRARLMHHLGIDLVLDVGANQGQFGLGLRQALGYRGQIVSFEPLQAPFALLQQAAAGDADWQVMQVALGAAAGPAAMFVAGNSESSSLLEMLPLHRAAAPASHCVGTESVALATLDTLLPQLRRGARHIWLKIDTQGYEHQVLQGAAGHLAQLQVVQLEMSLRPLYAGAPLLQQTQQLMGELGFRCVGLEPGFCDPRTGELLQADGIFLRDLPAPRS